MSISTTATKSSAELPSLSVRELDHFDYLAKIRHWLRSDCWSPGGDRLRFKNPAYAIGDVRLEEGNIVHARPLVGRPCFGIATALLRYEHATRYVKGRGHLPTGRCNQCEAKSACRWVITNRLKSNVSLETAWTAWLQDGGPSTFDMPHFERSHAYRLWGALVRELQRQPFTSVNDQHVLEAYQEIDRAAREADRDRKAKDRRRARRSGEIDEHDLQLLAKAQARRGVDLVRAATDDHPPKQLVGVPRKSLVEMMDVWLGKEVLIASGIQPTLGKIATWIEDSGRSNSSKNHAALQTRVSRDLKRIKKFERVPWRGDVLLPPLDRRAEFPSEISVATLGAGTP